MLGMQITYGYLPYFQTTPPMAKTSPTSAPDRREHRNVRQPRRQPADQAVGHHAGDEVAEDAPPALSSTGPVSGGWPLAGG